MRFLIVGAVMAVALLPEPRGPFSIELPIRALTPAHQEVAERVLAAKRMEWGGADYIRAGDGVLSMVTGGLSAEFLLNLSEIRATLAELDLALDPEGWVLKPQMMAFAVSAERAITAARVSPVLRSVRGVLQDGDRTLLVVELDEETEYAAIRESLDGIGVHIDDLVWGHWRDGWGIEERRPEAHVFGARHPSQQVPPLVTQAEYDRWRVELSNWGRWGPDDELGALNLITPAKRRAAAALVREGITVSLASTAQTERTIDNPCPIEWEMVSANRGGATDRVAYPCIHGPGTTHIDSFAHRFFDGLMWNGYPVADLVTREEGAKRNAILTLKDGIVTRGVLYDIPLLKGVPYLEPGTRITIADLEAWEAFAGVRAGPGDAMLLRWGRWARQDEIGPFDTGREAAGPDNTVIRWLKERDIALIGWETPGYMPQPPGDLPRLALHDFALTMLGIHLLDRADFDALAEVAAAHQRWEFMLTIGTLPIPNGTGSPVNPIAIF